MDRYNFSANLKELMESISISQSELAKKIGVTQKCVSKWANAQSEPTLSNIVALCEFFDVSADELIGMKKVMFFRQ